jgi:hypothetical protein
MCARSPSTGTFGSDRPRWCRAGVAHPRAVRQVRRASAVASPERRLAREGVELDVSTLADWVGAAAVTLMPLVGARAAESPLRSSSRRAGRMLAASLRAGAVQEGADRPRGGAVHRRAVRHRRHRAQAPPRRARGAIRSVRPSVPLSALVSIRIEWRLSPK